MLYLRRGKSPAQKYAIFRSHHQFTVVDKQPPIPHNWNQRLIPGPYLSTCVYILPAWIIHCTHYKVWTETIHPHSTGHMITHPGCDYSQSILVKRFPVGQQLHKMNALWQHLSACHYVGHWYTIVPLMNIMSKLHGYLHLILDYQFLQIIQRNVSHQIPYSDIEGGPIAPINEGIWLRCHGEAPEDHFCQ